MTQFRVEIFSDRYPKTFDVEASGVDVAVSKAMKLWKQRFKGSRCKEWKLKIVAAQ